MVTLQSNAAPLVTKNGTAMCQPTSRSQFGIPMKVRLSGKPIEPKFELERPRRIDPPVGVAGMFSIARRNSVPIRGEVTADNVIGMVGDWHPVPKEDAFEMEMSL